MMKKLLISGLCLFSFSCIRAQTVVDFETTFLAADTFNNGADLSGGFTYGQTHFSNYYNTTFNYNTGFSVSNKTDVTTPGYLNQYSAITGGGFNSSKYAVYYPDGQITLFTPTIQPPELVSVRITNTTYAYLSMLNGDAVGKKFGESINAQGETDGTDGEDYFILKIYGTSQAGDTTGVVEVVLADFRFADNSQDYILQDWLEVDLQTLNPSTGGVAYLTFSFESSDNGTFGINTPTYFAMDNFQFLPSSVGISENALETDRMYPNPVSDLLYFESNHGKVSVLSTSGNLLAEKQLNGNNSIDFSLFPMGVYLVRLENDRGTFTKKIIK